MSHSGNKNKINHVLVHAISSTSCPACMASLSIFVLLLLCRDHVPCWTAMLARQDRRSAVLARCSILVSLHFSFHLVSCDSLSQYQVSTWQDTSHPFLRFNLQNRACSFCPSSTPLLTASCLSVLCFSDMHSCLFCHSVPFLTLFPPSVLPLSLACSPSQSRMDIDQHPAQQSHSLQIRAVLECCFYSIHSACLSLSLALSVVV